MSKRILIISEGLDRSESQIIIGMHQRGLVLEVMMNPAHPRFSELEEQGVKIVPLELKGRIDFNGIRQIRARVKKGVRLIHCLRNNRPLANALIATMGMPAVPIVAYRGTMGNLGWWDPGSRTTYLHKRVTRLIAVSEGVRQYLMQDLGLPEEKVVTIHKGHRPEWYEQETLPDPAAFNIQPDEFVIGCVANMRPLKGNDTVIKALEFLPPKPLVHLLLIGKVQDDEIHRLAKANATPHRVNLVGFRNDAPAVAGLSDIFVMASKRREGLPRAVIEAMSQGIPAVVTRVGGMPELVEDGISGLVVPPDDPQKLAEAFQRYLADPSLVQEHGKGARERIATAFHVDRSIEKTIALYDQVSGEGG